MPDYTVAIVVDRLFGERLLQLAKTVPVWIAASETNRVAVEAAWALHKVHAPEYDVTIINAGADLSGEDLLFSELRTIDEHYPFWSTMQIYGVSLSPLITDALKNLGAGRFYDVAGGFVAMRVGRDEVSEARQG